MEPFSPWGLRHICGLVFWLSLQDKPLNIHPTQSFGRKSFVLLGHCLIIIEEENAAKEVKEEETSNQDEYDEEDHSLFVEFLFRTLVNLCNIQGVDHDIGPTFKTGNDEKGDHGVTDIVKIVIENRPLTSSLKALHLGMKPVHID